MYINFKNNNNCLKGRTSKLLFIWNCEKINVYFLTHPFCGIILWQSPQKNTLTLDNFYVRGTHETPSLQCSLLSDMFLWEYFTWATQGAAYVHSGAFSRALLQEIPGFSTLFFERKTQYCSDTCRLLNLIYKFKAQI